MNAVRLRRLDRMRILAVYRRQESVVEYGLTEPAGAGRWPADTHG
jgi:hypothetical protein